jgi:hypothetical protein
MLAWGVVVAQRVGTTGVRVCRESRSRVRGGVLGGGVRIADGPKGEEKLQASLGGLR